MSVVASQRWPSRGGRSRREGGISLGNRPPPSVWWNSSGSLREPEKNKLKTLADSISRGHRSDTFSRRSYDSVIQQEWQRAFTDARTQHTQPSTSTQIFDNNCCKAPFQLAHIHTHTHTMMQWLILPVWPYKETPSSGAPLPGWQGEEGIQTFKTSENTCSVWADAFIVWSRFQYRRCRRGQRTFRTWPAHQPSLSRAQMWVLSCQCLLWL